MGKETGLGVQQYIIMALVAINTVLLGVGGYFARDAYHDIKVDLRGAMVSGVAREVRIADHDARLRSQEKAIDELKLVYRDVREELRKLNQSLR
jgi:hypothetical protein